MHEKSKKRFDILIKHIIKNKKTQVLFLLPILIAEKKSYILNHIF